MRGLQSKPPREKVRCMDCEEFDIVDMWCVPKGKDILDPYEMIRCRRFVKIKEAQRSTPTTKREKNEV